MPLSVLEQLELLKESRATAADARLAAAEARESGREDRKLDLMVEAFVVTALVGTSAAWAMVEVNRQNVKSMVEELPLKHDVAELKTDVAELKTDVAELKTDVAVLKTDVAVLKTDVAGLKTDVKELRTDVAGLKTTVDQILAFLVNGGASPVVR